MNHTDKKCLFGAAAGHTLLLAILVIGPAFLPLPTKLSESDVLTIIPDTTTDKPFSRVGTPNVTPPASAPTPQPPKVEVKPEKLPEPTPPLKPEVKLPEPRPVDRTPEPEKVKPEPVTPPKSPDPDFTQTTPPKKKLPDVNLTQVVRNSSTKPAKPTTRATSEDEPDPRARSREFSSTARNLRQNLSGATSLDTPGPDSGGPSYANYGQVVKSVYTHAWIEPQSVTDEEATATVSITIARDGSVISSRITTPSGNAQIDASVLRTLQRVTFIKPFPAGAKDEQRTYNINFNLKAKRLLG
jgi:TonB family protein